MIEAPLAESPAEEIGIRRGERLLQIDDFHVEGSGGSEVAHKSVSDSDLQQLHRSSKIASLPTACAVAEHCVLSFATAIRTLPI